MKKAAMWAKWDQNVRLSNVRLPWSSFLFHLTTIIRNLPRLLRGEARRVINKLAL